MSSYSKLAESDAGIGTLAEQYFGKAGRIIATAVLIIFLYALIAAYVSGGGSLLKDLLPESFGDKVSILLFTVIFGSFIVIGTHSVDKINRVLFFRYACCLCRGVKLNVARNQI